MNRANGSEGCILFNYANENETSLTDAEIKAILEAKKDEFLEQGLLDRKF